MTMANMDKVFAQNWIEQMRTEFGQYPFVGYIGEPLTYMFESHPHTLVNCFWWHQPGSDCPWGFRDNALPDEVFVR